MREKLLGLLTESWASLVTHFVRSHCPCWLLGQNNCCFRRHLCCFHSMDQVQCEEFFRIQSHHRRRSLDLRSIIFLWVYMLYDVDDSKIHRYMGIHTGVLTSTFYWNGVCTCTVYGENRVHVLYKLQVPGTVLYVWFVSMGAHLRSVSHRVDYYIA